MRREVGAGRPSTVRRTRSWTMWRVALVALGVIIVVQFVSMSLVHDTPTASSRTQSISKLSSKPTRPGGLDSKMESDEVNVVRLPAHASCITAYCIMSPEQATKVSNLIMRVPTGTSDIRK